MPERNCSICRHPRRADIEAELAKGTPFATIEKALKAALAQPAKGETIKRHFAECLDGYGAPAGPVAGLSAPAPPPSPVPVAAGPPASPSPGLPIAHTGKRPDFAVAVEAKASELLEAGMLRVTTRDGLAARALLDRRDEKAEERSFMLNLARLLSGGGGKAPAELTEGPTIIDVTPSESLLAPAHLRDGSSSDR